MEEKDYICPRLPAANLGRQIPFSMWGQEGIYTCMEVFLIIISELKDLLQAFSG